MKLLAKQVNFTPEPFKGTVRDKVVVVEMAPLDDKVGSIYIPESVQYKVKADIGAVVASGDKNFTVGEYVYVRWDKGKRIQGLHQNILCFLGKASTVSGTFFDYDASEAAVCDMEYNPKGKNVLIKRNKLESGILTTQTAYDPVSEVVKVGTDCEVKPGDRIIFTQNPHKDVVFDGLDDHFLISEDRIHAIIE